MTPQRSEPLKPVELLPDPNLLRYYNEHAGPDAARKIIEEFTATLAHRRLLEERKQQWDFDLQKRDQTLQGWAQFFAFIVAVTAIAGGLWLASMGTQDKLLTGGIISGGTVGGIVYAFLKTRRSPNQQ